MNEFWPTRTTGDDDSIDRRLHEGSIVPQTPTADDLLWAADFLATYCVSEGDHAGDELVQAFANAIGLLVRKADEIDKRKATAAAKRDYAASHGIPVSKVRVKR